MATMLLPYLDLATNAHFDRWLAERVSSDEQETVTSAVLRALDAVGTCLIDEGRSWGEIARLGGWS